MSEHGEAYIHINMTGSYGNMFGRYTASVYSLVNYTGSIAPLEFMSLVELRQREIFLVTSVPSTIQNSRPRYKIEISSFSMQNNHEPVIQS